MKNLFNKYKFPLRLSDLGNQEDLKNYEDFNHIIDANGVEILGTSEWLRVEDEDAQDILDILNEYNKLLEQIGKMQLEMYSKDEVENLIRGFSTARNQPSYSGLDKWIQDNLS